MKRLLTGHAIYFNRKHRRVGHLFQNGYEYGGIIKTLKNIPAHCKPIREPW